MNLTRRILEGIHEVELQVTPEFQKPKRVPEIITTVDMLAELGWITMSETLIFGGGGGKARVFKHPKVSNKIRVTYGPKTGVLVSALVLKPDESVVRSIRVSPEGVYQTAQSLMKEAGV